MDALDISVVDELLEELSPDEPCGADLEYDPLFLEFNQACSSKPEVQYGGTIVPATVPEWKLILPQALSLLRRSRDLRVAVPFTRALLQLQGFSGLAVGLRLIEQLLEQRWDTVHPQLDPDDANDPMIRVNTLSAFCDGTGILRDIKEAVLISSRAHGHFTLRDIDMATGEIEVAEGVAKPALGLIEAAIADIDLDTLLELQLVLESSAACGEAIEASLTARVGAAQALSLSEMQKIMRRALSFIREKIAPRTGGTANEAATDGDGVVASADSAAGRLARGEIADRDDVLLAITRICDYYQQHEPSSPVPLLLQRAHRLATKNFLEIMEDLAPEGLNQAYSVSGVQQAS